MRMGRVSLSLSLLFDVVLSRIFDVLCRDDGRTVSPAGIGWVIRAVNYINYSCRSTILVNCGMRYRSPVQALYIRKTQKIATTRLTALWRNPNNAPIWLGTTEINTPRIALIASHAI